MTDDLLDLSPPLRPAQPGRGGPMRAARRALGRLLPAPLVRAWRRFARGIGHRMPRGLFGRSLLIVVAPMVILQSVVAYVFLERHWDLVTRRLSQAVARDIASVVAFVERDPANADAIATIFSETLDLEIAVLPYAALPQTTPWPLVGLLDQVLRDEMELLLPGRYWIDTGGNNPRRPIEVRVLTDEHLLRFLTARRNAYASNSHIFLLWMTATALVLMIVAVLFLRKQVTPIEQLADAAERFGKGQPIGDFQPSGAREVRRAAHAFIAMRRRIERQIEQRTTMLAGVSHDLRTVLTRFRLELALLAPERDTAPIEGDVAEMEAMLESYLAFARGTHDEAPRESDVGTLVAEIVAASPDAARIAVHHEGEKQMPLRPVALRRMLGNLLANATRYGTRVEVTTRLAEGWLTLTVDDDGPGVPETERETVFRPFYRLEAARTLAGAGSGLGLAIARDAARSHGGDIKLESGPLGGLRAVVRLPA